jgi:hypothetical protein
MAPVSDHTALPLPVVDARTLDERHQRVLLPDQVLRDSKGRQRRLPRFFYEVDSWQTAQSVELSEHFSLWEFLTVDVREAEPLRTFPRYVPCAVTALAAHLELLREAVGTFIHLSANGGYRSPRHALTDAASRHCWGTAANIYLIGDDYLDTQEKIERYGRMAEKRIPGCWVRPYGHEKGFADDHLHIDLGYMLVVPHEAPSEEACGDKEARQ